MKIIKDYPPNIEEIQKTFGRKAIANAVFTYAPHVYYPDGRELPEHLVAHEQTHLGQQGDKPAEWWGRYLVDPQFRLEQEVEAYRVQYQNALETLPRKTRRQLLQQISRDLSGPLYGYIINFDQAKEAITA
jgi:hypothetical protein